MVPRYGPTTLGITREVSHLSCIGFLFGGESAKWAMGPHTHTPCANQGCSLTKLRQGGAEVMQEDILRFLEKGGKVPCKGMYNNKPTLGMFHPNKRKGLLRVYLGDNQFEFVWYTNKLGKKPETFSVDFGELRNIIEQGFADMVQEIPTEQFKIVLIRG